MLGPAIVTMQDGPHGFGHDLQARSTGTGWDHVFRLVGIDRHGCSTASVPEGHAPTTAPEVSGPLLPDCVNALVAFPARAESNNCAILSSLSLTSDGIEAGSRYSTNRCKSVFRSSMGCPRCVPSRRKNSSANALSFLVLVTLAHSSREPSASKRFQTRKSASTPSNTCSKTKSSSTGCAVPVQSGLVPARLQCSPVSGPVLLFPGPTSDTEGRP